MDNKETAKCKMCSNDTEDLELFLLICGKLEDERKSHLNTLKCYIENIKKGTFEDKKDYYCNLYWTLLPKCKKICSLKKKLY